MGFDKRGGLLVDPASRLDGLPVLSGKVILLVVDDMGIHELVDLVKIEKWDHWVGMVFRVVVSVPQQCANDNVGADAASIEQAVGLLGDFAIGMLEVAEVVHNRVAAQDGRNPPEQHALEAFLGLTKDVKHGGVAGEHGKCRHLKSAHDAALLFVGPVPEAPPSAAVVDGDSHGGVEDPAGAAREDMIDVNELVKVVDATERYVAKARVLQLFAGEVAGELGVLVDVVGVGMMPLVHDFLVDAELKAKDALHKEAEVVDPPGLEGIAMEKLVLPGKGKALELESVEKVDRNEHDEFHGGEALFIKGEDVHLMDSKYRERHDAEVGEEALHSFVVGLLHELDQDAIVEDAITLHTLALNVLDIGPFFVVTFQVGEVIGDGLFIIKQFNQGVMEGLGLVE
jgi:hypothetical protein